jgi:DNA polymerase bacteriophage-type
MQERPPRATVDFETRSAASLNDVGTWRYSIDPTTEVMVMSYRLPHWEPGRVERWHPAYPHANIPEAQAPWDLFDWINEGGLVEAHNAFFEYCIWLNQQVPKRGWPEVPDDQWRCSAAKAATHSLPRNLEEANEAMKLSVVKDVEGAKLMKKMVKPRKLLKREIKAGLDPSRLHWKEEREDLLRLFQYCDSDVLAEEALSEALLDLTPNETKMFLMDMAINRRGFQLDGEAVHAALRLIDEASTEMNKELVELTGGQVQKATQRAKMLRWLEAEGLPLTDTQGATLDKVLKRKDLPPRARRGVELVRELGRSSTAKYVAMQDWADPRDWKVRGGLLYHGAGTGRWSGKGVQPHNFPRGNIKDQVTAWDIIKDSSLHPLIEALYPDLLTLLSHALRGAIVPSPGHELCVADYSAIEARVLLWLAGDERALEIFRRGDCIYCDMATDIYRRPITKANTDERQMGKQAVLGLGYGMGAPKFTDTVAKYGIKISEDFAKFVVSAYREKYARVPAMWKQYEAAAIEAVQTGRTVTSGRVSWRVVGRFLYCRLPSGRRLAYCDPAVVEAAVPWGGTKPTLTFMGVNPYSRQWERAKTYGGMLVENVTQAVARDLMAEAMLRCHEGGKYHVVLSVHDELIAETLKGTADVKEFERLMSVLPDWAAGCPVNAEGWKGMRYRK